MVQGSGAALRPPPMSCSDRRVCHMGRINPPAFIAAHQGFTSLPVHTVRMIIPPGLDDENIIFGEHTQKIALRLTGGCTAVVLWFLLQKVFSDLDLPWCSICILVLTKKIKCFKCTLISSALPFTKHLSQGKGI